MGPTFTSKISVARVSNVATVKTDNNRVLVLCALASSKEELSDKRDVGLWSPVLASFLSLDVAAMLGRLHHQIFKCGV